MPYDDTHINYRCVKILPWYWVDDWTTATTSHTHTLDMHRSCICDGMTYFSHKKQDYSCVVIWNSLRKTLSPKKYYLRTFNYLTMTLAKKYNNTERNARPVVCLILNYYFYSKQIHLRITVRVYLYIIYVAPSLVGHSSCVCGQLFSP